MAIYQFQVVLIPSQWASDAESSIDSLYDEEGYDVSEAWRRYQPTSVIAPLLKKVLPEGKAWDSEQKVWGNEEFSDVQVWFDNGKIESITIRLDLREDISQLASRVVDLTTELNCVLFLPGSKKIIQPDVFELNKMANESNAAKYVKDPEGFLSGVGSE